MKANLEEHGYEIIDAIYTEQEVDEIINLLKTAGVAKKFGVREFLVDYPEIKKKLFTNKLINVIHDIAPSCPKTTFKAVLGQVILFLKKTYCCSKKAISTC